MNRSKSLVLVTGLAVLGVSAMLGCRDVMPHALTWGATGDQIPTHPKPPEGGYYSNWDPYSVELEAMPVEDVNPVRTQHYIIATVKDKNGKPLPNRRVEWIINDGSVGDIVEVDESGIRASRGYKVTNDYAVSHTNNSAHVLDMGNDDPSDDISLTAGQTWCCITSPVEGTSYVTVYAPGIYDRSKHKVFVTKHWYDVRWEFPPPATNPTGTSHEFVTKISKYSDGTPLAGFIVTYKLLDGPDGMLEPGGNAKSAAVTTDAAGLAKITLRQTKPAEGTNNLSIDVMRPENIQCCKPAVHIATGRTAKTWIGPKIGIDKTCTANALVGDTVTYNIEVTNPSQVTATNVTVTDNIPDGISYVSSNPSGTASGQSVTWNLGSLKGQGKATIQVQAKATRVGKFENCAEVRADQNLQAKDCCTTTVTAPKLAIEKKCTSEATVCDPITYTITVRNAGDGVAKNVKITDNFPAGLTATDGKTSLTTTVGDLNPGQSKDVSVSLKATKSGRYENKVSATADGGLAADASCTTVVKQPMLEVVKTGPKDRFIGRPATYDITVSSKGDAPAKDTVLTDAIPGGMEFVSASDGGSNSGGTVMWRLGTLDPGASKKVSLTLKPTAAGTTENCAIARAVCAEAKGCTTTVNAGIPAILLEVIDVADPIEVGAQETYEIVVTNQGSAADTNIRIVCTLPPEQEYVSGSGPTQPTAAGKTVTFAPLPSLAAKSKASWKVVTKGLKASDSRFKVVLDSDQTTSPVEETESTHIYE